MNKALLLYENKSLGALVEPLLTWYDESKRDLPWRENTDPYRVWVSEIMLQQTRVEAVKGYYTRFLSALPDISALAAAEEDQLYKLWEGLGYYSRVRNLQKAARIICEQYGGVFPVDYERIAALPGIGAYTAGAVASIAFGLPTPAVDGNVLRVISRLCENPLDITSGAYKREVSEALAGIYPMGRCGDFTQGLMELGAIVCLPNGAPLCEGCPLRALCRAARNGSWERYPVKKEKPRRKVEHKTVFLMQTDSHLAVRKRKAAGVLNGMWELPCVDGALSEAQARAQLARWGVRGEPIAQREKKHIFTHIEWIIHPYLVHCGEIPQTFRSVSTAPDERELALPSAFAKLLK